MKKRYYIIHLVMLLFALGACKDNIMLFDEKEDAVYFPNVNGVDSIIYTFRFGPTETTKDTIHIPVQLLGTISNTDRRIDVKVDSTEDAVEGIDFEIIRPFRLKSDTNFTDLRVVLHRTAPLKEKAKYVYLSLTSTGEIPAAIWPGKTNFSIRFSDKLEKPSWWTTQLGNYSERRHSFYLDTFGVNQSPTELFGTTNGFAIAIYRLKIATIEYNNTHDEPLQEENGTPIVWEQGLDWINW